MRRKMLLMAFAIMCCVQILAQQVVCSDYWAATDALGRKVQRYDGKKKEKTVIMFYWTWHEWEDPEGAEVKNISQIIREFPEARQDANHPAWTEKRPHNNYFWEEPLFGYYRTTDKWVLRKHAQMLADAGVDAVFFDCTNGSFTWDESTDSLLETWNAAQQDGVRVPKIGFMLPFAALPNSLVSLRHLYERIYKPGRYQNLWFYWKDKPCIMAYPDNLTDSEEDKAIRNFFTFRPGQPDYVDGPFPNRNDQWGWLENYPQHGYVDDGTGKYELVTVGIAQNACPETKGHCSAFNLPGSHSRSYSYQHGFDPRTEGYLYGWNFLEQWDRVFELDPQAVFVTGWNEWTGGMWFEKDGWTGKPFSFVDLFDWDRSRDIEPVKSWGDRGDVYYLQLVDRIRKFKGTSVQPMPSEQQTIGMKDWESWEEIEPVYADYKGDVMHRAAKGRCQYYYTDHSGRNDIVTAKVARDADYVYFYVETNGVLSEPSGRNWMMLFLDTDRRKETGWEGYDFVLNYHSPKKGKTTLCRSVQNKWIWEEAGNADIKINENKICIRVSRRLMGMENKPLDFEFKWVDNMQDDGNVMDFYVSGDTAPGGRFNYIFKEQ